MLDHREQWAHWSVQKKKLPKKPHLPIKMVNQRLRIKHSVRIAQQVVPLLSIIILSAEL